MDGPLTRRAWRRLARWFGAAAEWCYRRAAARWAWTTTGVFYRGRLVGPMPPPWKVVLRGDPCAYCGGPTVTSAGGSSPCRAGRRPTGARCAGPVARRASDTIDHVTAKAAGGLHGWPNEVGACRRCNEAKGATPLVAWLRMRLAAERAAERAEAARRATTQRHLTRRERFARAVQWRNVSQPSRPPFGRGLQSGGHR